MTQEERTRLSRELILDGAVREFGRHGYVDASVNRICKENGISKGRLFHHFKNKDEIFLATAQLCYEGLIERTRAFQPDSGKTLEENFHDYFSWRQQYFLNYPYRAVLMASQSLRRPSDEFREQIGKMRERFERCNLEKLRGILTSSTQTISVPDEGLLLQVFHVASYFIHLHVGSPNWDPEIDMRPVADHSLAVFDQVVHMLLYGVLSQRENLPPENGALLYRYLSKGPEWEQADDRAKEELK